MSGPQTAAARGAKLLDRHRPGWWREVRLTKLDQGKPYPRDDDDCSCVLAQLYGSYGTGLEPLSKEGLWSNGGVYLHGFDAETFTDLSALTEAWKDEIRARRKVPR